MSLCLGNDVCLMSTDVTQSRETIEKAYMDFDGNVRRPGVNWIIKSLLLYRCMFVETMMPSQSNSLILKSVSLPF